MQTRIIASLIGIALGLVAATYIETDLGLSGTPRYAAFAISGLVLGIVVSILIDVFSGNTGASPTGPGE